MISIIIVIKLMVNIMDKVLIILHNNIGKQYTKTNILVYDGDFFEGKYHNFGTLKYLNTVNLKENFNY